MLRRASFEKPSGITLSSSSSKLRCWTSASCILPRFFVSFYSLIVFFSLLNRDVRLILLTGFGSFVCFGTGPQGKLFQTIFTANFKSRVVHFPSFPAPYSLGTIFCSSTMIGLTDIVDQIPEIYTSLFGLQIVAIHLIVSKPQPFNY